MNEICNPDLYLLVHAKVCIDHSRRDRELEFENEINKRMEVFGDISSLVSADHSTSEESEEVISDAGAMKQQLSSVVRHRCFP